MLMLRHIPPNGGGVGVGVGVAVGTPGGSVAVGVGVLVGPAGVVGVGVMVAVGEGLTGVEHCAVFDAYDHGPSVVCRV